jgi:hypothetical protein
MTKKTTDLILLLGGAGLVGYLIYRATKKAGPKVVVRDKKTGGTIVKDLPDVQPEDIVVSVTDGTVPEGPPSVTPPTAGYFTV